MTSTGSDRPSRRAVLRAAGAAIALPWLESLAPRRCPRVPVRMAFCFMPNGVLPRDWTPMDAGSSFTLSPTLAPLAPVRDSLLVCSGLWNRNADEGEGHYVKTTSLLSGARVRRSGGRDLRCGTSVDQVAASLLGDETPLPSIELGIEPARHVVDMGYSTVYGATIAWRSPTEPMPKEIRPRQAFERLFRGGRRGETGEASVLDLVLGEARAVERRLGAADRDRMGEYLESVRTVERRIAAFDAQRAAHAQALFRAREVPERAHDHAEHVRLMFELIELAFRSDTTRIATLMLGNSVSGVDFSFLEGVRGGHHDLSHHGGDAEKMRQYARINRWFVERFAEFCTRLAAIEEGDGTLLDASMLVFAAAIRDGDRHDPHDLPIVLCGRGGGALASGDHVRFRHDSPLTDLWRTMLHVFGCPVRSFSDSRGVLDELLR
ncbi:MAG: DUF1552 domain-containing protein [Planctomycetes bacterium]|nr:DUF1552 domain-containing protein [Planctomycetota bacterium]